MKRFALHRAKALLTLAAAIIGAVAIGSTLMMSSHAADSDPSSIADGSQVTINYAGLAGGGFPSTSHIKTLEYNGTDYGVAFCIQERYMSPEGTETGTVSNLVGTAYDKPTWPDMTVTGTWTDRMVQDAAIANKYFFDGPYSGDFQAKYRGFQRWLWCFQAADADLDASVPSWYSNIEVNSFSDYYDSISSYAEVCQYVKDNRSKYIGHGLRINLRSLTGRSQDRVLLWTEDATAHFSLKKVSSNATITNGNANYKLAGAEYTVYGNKNDADNNQNAITTLTTNDKGETQAADVAISKLADGTTAYVKETKAPAGFKQDTQTHTITLTPDQTATLNVKDMPITTKPTPYTKKDLESLTPTAQGNATLAGAEYTVTLNDGTKDIKHWTFKTDEKGNINFDNAHKTDGDDIYTDDKGNSILPLGTYTIKETKAPEGYKLDKNTYTIKVTQDNNDAKTTPDFKNLTDQVKREDLNFQKKANDTQDRMANIAFLVTSKTTGESHVIITDENGTYSSTANQHTQNTNANDKTITKDSNGNITIDETKLDPTAGTYFTGYANDSAEAKAVKPDDNKGAFPYDEYEIQELRTSANKGYNVITVNVTLHHDDYELNYGTLDDSPIGIHTTATDSETHTHYATSSEKTTIIDTVDYHGLTPGKEYTLTGTAHLVNADGSDGGVIDGATNTITFTPSEAEGSVDVPVSFDSSKLSGSSVVMFEDLLENGVSVATHADISDEGQTVRFPSIHTTATDEGDGDKEVDVSKPVVIDDEVSYEGLVPGREYTMTGVLHHRGADGSDAGVLTDRSGKEVSSTVRFVPVASSGSVIVRFSFEADVDDGTVLVAFEDCREGDVLVASHADISDEGQSVTARKPAPVVEQVSEKITQTGSSLSGAAVFGGIAAVCGIAMLMARKNRR